MKCFLIISLVIACTVIHAQDNVLPQTVESAYKNKYQNQKIDGWWEEDGLFYIEFTLKGESYTSVFNGEGGWKETASTISEMDIPKPLQDYISNTFPGGKISFCEDVETNESAKFLRVTLIDAEKVFHVIRSDHQGGHITFQDNDS
jgi:hypothetical protein